jgi:hypothetical protein
MGIGGFVELGNNTKLFVGEKSGRFLTTFPALKISIYFYAKLTISLRKTYSIMPHIFSS